MCEADRDASARGYDDTLLGERRHLSRADLDQVSTSRPVLAIHISAYIVAVVILSADPLDPANELRAIEVERTVVAGVSIYEAATEP